MRRKLPTGESMRVWNNTCIRATHTGALTIDRVDGFCYPGRFGPEMGIGVVLDDTEAVLFIKTSRGGVMLYFDYWPPSSGPGNFTSQP